MKAKMFRNMMVILAALPSAQVTAAPLMQKAIFVEGMGGHKGDVTDVRVVRRVESHPDAWRLWQPFVAQWKRKHLVVAFGAMINGKKDMGDIFASVSKDDGGYSWTPVEMAMHYAGTLILNARVQATEVRGQRRFLLPAHRNSLQKDPLGSREQFVLSSTSLLEWNLEAFIAQPEPELYNAKSKGFFGRAADGTHLYVYNDGPAQPAPGSRTALRYKMKPAGGVWSQEMTFYDAGIKNSYPTFIEVRPGDFRAVWDSGTAERPRTHIRFGKLRIAP